LDGSRNPGACADIATLPVRVIDPLMYPKASRAKIAKAWTNLAQGFVDSQDKFTHDENASAEAILMQIQGALLALGFVPVGKATTKPEYVPQLIPNTSALARYLERKHRENPKIKDFAKLCAAARSLAYQINIVAPIIPASAMKTSQTDNR
jgi:hypothetical protein